MNGRQNLRKGLITFSVFLFPAIYYYFSPYLIVDATMKRIINGSFIVFVSMFLSALIMGRAFCGWVCPAGGCQEAVFPARNKKVTKGNFVKWIIWVPWVTVIVVLAIKSKGYERIDFFYQTTYGLSIGDVYSLITYLFVVFLIVVPAFIIGKRSFCHHLCWMAPFMIIGRKLRNLGGWSSLELTAKADKCSHCHTCSRECPMSLSVEDMVSLCKMENPECVLCGTCIDGCESDVIKYAFHRSKKKLVSDESCRNKRLK